MTNKEDVIQLDFKDGYSADCIVIGTFDAFGNDYMALAPADGADEVYIYQYTQINDSRFSLSEIESEDEWKKAATEFDSIIEESHCV